MELIPEWAPSIHPMLVHFPIAILSIAILFDFISFFLPKKQKWWSSEATAFLYGVGAVTAIIVYFTGQAAADIVFISAEAQTVLNTHADWALWTVWFYSIYALVRILAVWRIPPEYSRSLHVISFVLSLAGLFLLYQTGDNGARMVFEHGVGVQAAEVEDSEEPAAKSEETISGETAFDISDEGDWSWSIQSGAVKVLQEQFRFLSGSIDELKAESVQATGNTYALQFSGDDLDGFFVSNDRYQNVQVDYYLNLSAFDGTVTLANHVQDADGYDYVSISSDGTVEQGRMENGQREIFEKGKTDVSELLFVRVVANGTHFRGYIDKEMIVHGHGDAPEPGNVGLKMEGSGIILLQQMELVQL